MVLLQIVQMQAEQSLLSGVDMDMCSACYIQNLGESVENGSVTMDAMIRQ